MRAIKDLIKAHKDLDEANSSFPRHLLDATRKVQERLSVSWLEALEIVDLAHGGVKTKSMKPRPQKSKTSPKTVRVEKAGGLRRPIDVADIDRRLLKATGVKEQCYLMARELLKNQGNWVTHKRFKSLNINTGCAKNNRRMSACVPTNMIIKSSPRKGFIIDTAPLLLLEK